jgi:hypothetical protein
MTAKANTWKTLQTAALDDGSTVEMRHAEFGKGRANTQPAATFMSCPRNCGVDVGLHHSSDKVNGGCDTGPMSLDDMRAWFEQRGVGQPRFSTLDEVIAEHYGKTEDELDAIYDAMHGDMA